MSGYHRHWIIKIHIQEVAYGAMFSSNRPFIMMSSLLLLFFVLAFVPMTGGLSLKVYPDDVQVTLACNDNRMIQVSQGHFVFPTSKNTTSDMSYCPDLPEEDACLMGMHSLTDALRSHFNRHAANHYYTVEFPSVEDCNSKFKLSGFVYACVEYECLSSPSATAGSPVPMLPMHYPSSSVEGREVSLMNAVYGTETIRTALCRITPPEPRGSHVSVRLLDLATTSDNSTNYCAQFGEFCGICARAGDGVINMDLPRDTQDLWFWPTNNQTVQGRIWIWLSAMKDGNVADDLKIQVSCNWKDYSLAPQNSTEDCRVFHQGISGATPAFRQRGILLVTVVILRVTGVYPYGD